MKEGPFIFRARQAKEAARTIANDAIEPEARIIWMSGLCTAVGSRFVDTHPSVAIIAGAAVASLALYSGRRGRIQDRERMEINGELDLLRTAKGKLEQENAKLRHTQGNPQSETG